MTALAVLALLAWLYLAACRGGFWRDGERLAPRARRRRPPVAVVVPARDEAERGRPPASAACSAQDYPGAVPRRPGR